MALKDKWVDKVNNVDDVDADDINEIAGAVIRLEEQAADAPQTEEFARDVNKNKQDIEFIEKIVGVPLQYDFRNALYHENNESRITIQYKIGDIITFFVPMGWYAEINGSSVVTIAAEDKYEVYKLIADENTNIYFIDAGKNSGDDFDIVECPVIVTVGTNRLDDIENKIGDIDTALDELHEYAQALITGGAA